MLKTRLVLDRLSENGGLLERRDQPARSFLKRFIELLYIQHAEIPDGAPYWLRTIDSIDFIGMITCSSRYHNNNLRVGSLPGGASLYMGIDAYNDIAQAQTVPCSSLGLVVGNGTGAVTPTDERMGRVFGHGKRASDASPVIVESCTTGDDLDSDVYGNYWVGQAIVPRLSHRITSVRVKIWRTGNPGDLTVRIRGATQGEYYGGGTRRPGSGADLATGTITQASIPTSSPGSFVECTFATPADLYMGRLYFIILTHAGGDTSNHTHWRQDQAGPSYERAVMTRYGSFIANSYNGGSTWNPSDDKAYMFEEYGQSPGEFEMGGTELAEMNISDPTAQFTIRRLFANNCGQPLTVNEAGLTAFMGKVYNSSGYYYSSGDLFLIARDLVSPAIAVNNGEILRVSYVPQITV